MSHYLKRNPYRMKRKRKSLALSTKLAACLIQLGFISREDAAKKTVKQILALAEFDHCELHALGGQDHPANLWAIEVPEHREKSKGDTSAVAKHDRLLPDKVEHTVALEAKRGVTINPGDQIVVGGREYTYVAPKKRKKQWPKGRKIQSQGFQKRPRPVRQGSP